MVAAVADATDVRPVDLPPLFDTIEPEALDSVVESTDEGTEIVFEYHDHVVTVTSRAGGRVHVHASGL